MIGNTELDGGLNVQEASRTGGISMLGLFLLRRVPYDVIQLTAASSSICRRCRPALILVNERLLTVRDIVWVSPHAHLSPSDNHRSLRQAAQWSCTV